MRKTLIAMLVGVLLSGAVASSALAEFVYVTKNGKKYHSVDSKYSQYEGVEKITLEEAEERGLGPSKSYLKSKKRLEEEEKEK